MRFLLCTILATWLLACGGSEDAPTAPRKRPPPRGGTSEVREVAEPGAGGGSASGGATVPEEREEVRFRLSLARREFDVGERIEARLTLENVGSRPLRIFDPERALTADLKFTVKTPAGRRVIVKQHREIPEDSVLETDLVTLRPEEKASVTMDLTPTIRTAGEGQTGTYEIRAAFTGGYQGTHLTMDLWNRGGGKVAESATVYVELKWPARLTRLGITPELTEQVEKLLGKVGRDGILTEGARDALASLGDKVIPVLAEKLACISSRTPKKQVVGWSAFHLLREGGEAARAALEEAPASAAAEMIRGWLEAEQRETAKQPPPPDVARVRERLLDPELRKSTVLTVARVSGKEGRGEESDTEVLRVDGAGRIQLERGEVRREATLDAEEIDSLFGVLIEERVWLLTPGRTFGHAEEGLVKFDLTIDGGADGAAEETLWRAEIWATEADLYNRSLSRVLTALRKARLALR